MAEWLLLSGSSVLTRCEAPDKASATERFRPKNGQRVVSAASWELDQAVPTREARTPRGNTPAAKRLKRRAEASARWRAREKGAVEPAAPGSAEGATATLSGPDESREAGGVPSEGASVSRDVVPPEARSDGQRKRWLNDPEGAKARSRLMNAAKHSKGAS